MSYKTIAEAKAANRANGWHFFDRSTMRFFRSKICSEILNGKYFVTSEQFEPSWPRLFTLRRINWETGDIITVGEFQGYRTVKEARAAAYEQGEDLCIA